MSTFFVLVLVCSLATGHSDCTPDTAIDTAPGGKIANEMMCGLQGQIALSQTTLAPRPGREYLKVMCLRGK